MLLSVVESRFYTKNESIPKNNNPLNVLKTNSTVNHKHNGRYVGKIDANDA